MNQNETVLLIMAFVYLIACGSLVAIAFLVYKTIKKRFENE
jgi:hypothetical protein